MTGCAILQASNLRSVGRSPLGLPEFQNLTQRRQVLKSKRGFERQEILLCIERAESSLTSPDGKEDS